MFALLLLFFCVTTLGNAKTIDNKLKETPSVKCGPEKISIEGNTEEVFEGVIFIKNHRRKEGCSASYAVDSNSTNPSYSIALDSIAQCGLELRRNSETKELEIFTVFVFSFHPNFVTAGDRSFAVHCIFLQQQVTVATKFNFIADITTKGIIGATAEMPSIGMTIVEGRVPNPSLHPAQTVAVGEQLMYVWYLKADTEIYGIRVRDCFAETKDGQKMKIINNGCTSDSLIVSNVQYAENSLKAFADAMAFKFPDAEDVWLTCSVSICIRRFEHLIAKDDENLCDTQPKCGEREKRSTDQEASAVSIYSIDDLVHHKLRVTDSPSYEALALKQRNLTSNVVDSDGIVTEALQLCLQKGTFAGASAALLSAYFVTACLAGAVGFSLYRSHHQKRIIEQ